MFKRRFNSVLKGEFIDIEKTVITDMLNIIRAIEHEHLEKNI